MRFSYVVFFSFVCNLFFLSFFFFLNRYYQISFIFLPLGSPRLALSTIGARSFIVLLPVKKIIRLSCLVLSCLYMYSEKYLSFKYILPQFRLIFNVPKKQKGKTSVVRNEREAITPVLMFHRVRLETVTSCRREWL